MKYLVSIFVVMFIAVRCYCGEWQPLPDGVSWDTLTNTANFHELHSTTNLPPEVLSYALTVLGSMGVQAGDRERMAEPGEPLEAGSRLVWAATDGSCYIVYFEFVSFTDSSHSCTNYCIAGGIRQTESTKFIFRSAQYSHRFKDFKDFMDLDSYIRREF